MKNYYPLIMLSALLLMFASCSTLRIEKRHYRNGFYVDFTNNASGSSDTRDTKAEPKTVNEYADAVSNDPAPTPSPTSEPAGNAAPQSEIDNIQKASEAGRNEEPIVETPADNEKNNPQEEATSQGKTIPHDDITLVLLVILAILLPPLAVFLVEGLSTWFWVTLILCLLGGGVFFYPYIGGLWLISIIIALLVVFGAI